MDAIFILSTSPGYGENNIAGKNRRALGPLGPAYCANICPPWASALANMQDTTLVFPCDIS